MTLSLELLCSHAIRYEFVTRPSNISNDVQKGSLSMYARVITVQHQPGKVDEGLQMFRESLVPAARQTQGFKGTLGLIDRATGKAIAISLRESVADMQATESSGYLQ